MSVTDLKTAKASAPSVVANTLQHEWGNFSDILRKAFQHEGASLFRRKDNEYIEIETPHLAIVLSGTPKQVRTLWRTPSSMNGAILVIFYEKPFEGASLFRRKDNEYIEIETPHLAIVLSGTPKQVRNLIPDVENGLFSRFLYYAFEDFSDFINPFVSHKNEVTNQCQKKINPY